MRSTLPTSDVSTGNTTEEHDMTPELKEEMIKELSALVAIPSVTDDRGACSRALEHVLDLAQSLGLQAREMKRSPSSSIST